jgi:hypothetical protein
MKQGYLCITFPVWDHVVYVSSSEEESFDLQPIILSHICKMFVRRVTGSDSACCMQ